jgi:hypothetical protein
LKPEAPAFLNLDVRPAVPRFASEVAVETARASLHAPEPAAATAYASGFGSQSLATLESTPSFEPIAPNTPASKERKPALTPEDSAIGGFLETLSADENRARAQRRAEEAELEELDVPAFMRKGGR